ncbi:MAG: universal stress protein [Bacteroidales bacterium]
MKNILVAIDFEEGSHHLIDKASEFAKVFDAKLWLMHIAAPDPDFVGYEPGPQYIRDSRAEELRDEHKKLQEYADALNSKGLDAEGLLIQGATTEMIMKESKKLKTDMIICGDHDRGFFYRAFAGDVTSRIIKKSKIPVLVVPLG